MPSPRCSWCEPEGHHTPSGYAYWHESTCERFASQKVRSAPKPENPKLVLVGGVRWGSPEDVPEHLDALTLHPACKAAYADGATPCGHCSWLLGLDNDGAAYVDHWADNR